MYDYYAEREVDGTAQRVHDLLRDKARRAPGRPATPSAAVIDAQSVKTSANISEASQGIDAGKKIKGRKRYVATDSAPAENAVRAAQGPVRCCGRMGACVASSRLPDREDPAIGPQSSRHFRSDEKPWTVLYNPEASSEVRRADVLTAWY
ncbi:hypothetical protein ACIHCV_42100 [Streptomyces sp. NPDC051956]|uniref:hypothetical protein n=1 Tax=Streptomyces sp. NPDC051956 TaxID=3365677 RepID=UPI0037D96A74